MSNSADNPPPHSPHPPVPRMKRQHGFLLALSLLLSACAGQAVRAPSQAPAIAAETGVDVAAVDDTANETAQTALAVPAQAGAAAQVAVVDPAVTAAEPATQTEPPAAAPTTAAEDDFNALYGHPEYDPVADSALPPGVELPSSYDPWEPFNRRMHALNNFIDRTVATPLARLYVKAIPRPMRLGVSNFFNNLGQPVSAINALLQGRPRDAGFSLLRFAVNTTIGGGGLFDPASKLKIPYRDEDFGQTLAVWGWRKSRYIELPIFGPRTVRDIFGMAGDAPLSPLPHIGQEKAQAALRALQLADIRTRLFSIDAMREGVADEYALYRDAWLQRRNYQITSGLRRAQQAEADNLPDYLQEEPDNPTIPIDAIPINP